MNKYYNIQILLVLLTIILLNSCTDKSSIKPFYNSSALIFKIDTVDFENLAEKFIKEDGYKEQVYYSLGGQLGEIFMIERHAWNASAIDYYLCKKRDSVRVDHLLSSGRVINLGGRQHPLQKELGGLFSLATLYIDSLGRCTKSSVYPKFYYNGSVEKISTITNLQLQKDGTVDTINFSKKTHLYDEKFSIK